MKADLEKFLGEFEAGLKDCQRFAYMVRGKEFQVGAVDQLGHLAQRADALKRSAQEREDEDNANALLALQTVALALRSELEMFIALKEERGGELGTISSSHRRGHARRFAPTQLRIPSSPIASGCTSWSSFCSRPSSS